MSCVYSDPLVESDEFAGRVWLATTDPLLLVVLVRQPYVFSVRVALEALEAAARYYCHMHGAATPGALDDLLELAVDQANVTPGEIADLLDHDTLPLQVDVDVEIGADN